MSYRFMKFPNIFKSYLLDELRYDQNTWNWCFLILFGGIIAFSENQENQT